MKKYDFFQTILNKFCADSEDEIEKFCKIVKNNRNYYTHYGKKQEYVEEGKKLIELNEGLNLVIKLIFLKELDFDLNEINEITSKDILFRLHEYVNWM